MNDPQVAALAALLADALSQDEVWGSFSETAHVKPIAARLVAAGVHVGDGATGLCSAHQVGDPSCDVCYPTRDYALRAAGQAVIFAWDNYGADWEATPFNAAMDALRAALDAATPEERL